MCKVKFSLLSRVIPSSLKTSLTAILPGKMISLRILFLILLFVTNMKSVLLQLISSLFNLHHSSIGISFLTNSQIKRSKSSFDSRSVVSSAKSLHNKRMRAKSLINIKKKSEPSTLPCGTPNSMFTADDNVLFNLTDCDLSE